MKSHALTLQQSTWSLITTLSQCSVLKGLVLTVKDSLGNDSVVVRMVDCQPRGGLLKFREGRNLFYRVLCSTCVPANSAIISTLWVVRSDGREEGSPPVIICR